jgi:hypothetical protein
MRRNGGNMGIFSGLETLGLGKLKNTDIYVDEEQKKREEEEAAKKKAAKRITEEDCVFDKKLKCPVCDKEFKTKTVKTGRAKLIGQDSDLRPKYQVVDSLKYDAVLCPNCGYAALSRFFNYMSSTQAKRVYDQIGTSFKGSDQTDEPIYTYDQAIMRHKLALLSTVVKKGKMSERAYVCLKLAWLIRGKSETLPEDTPDIENVRKQLHQDEMEFIENAYEGFTAAFSKEDFPICGMDELTVSYVVSDLARQLGKFDDAKRYISRILTSRDTNERIKSKARTLKDLIAENEHEAQQALEEKEA